MMSKGDGQRLRERWSPSACAAMATRPCPRAPPRSCSRRIVADQRDDHRATSPASPPSETPQVWALYKEVQDYYDHGMKVPDDVTLLFADDNWGQIRRLPTGDARSQGRLRRVLPLRLRRRRRATTSGSTPSRSRRPGSRWTSRTRAARGQLWIVNVGDIKPDGIPAELLHGAGVESGGDDASRR